MMDSSVAGGSVERGGGMLQLLGRSLECAICLERLRVNDNRVLPCQHTYHLDCLKLVLSRDKQLTCPECRRVSKVPIDRLLPNYTLNKVLETMPAMPQSSFANYNTSQTLDSNSYQSSYLQPSQTSIEDTLSSEKLSATSKSGAEGINYMQQGNLCKAIYPYKAQHPSCLSLNEGEVVKVLEILDNNWLRGEGVSSSNDRRVGLFPANHVEVIHASENIPLCTALFDFDQPSHSQPTSTGMALLNFKKDELIEITAKIDQNWANGRTRNASGIFPLNFVAVNNCARELLLGKSAAETILPNKSSVSSSDYSAINISTSSDQIVPQMHHLKSSSLSLQLRQLSLNESGDTTETTSTHERVVCKSNTISGYQYDHVGQNRRHSVNPTRSNENCLEANSRKSLQVEDYTAGRSYATSSYNASLPRLFVAVHDYKAVRKDEIDLIRGNTYIVDSICSDGWYKGVPASTFQSSSGTNDSFLNRGAFPGNFLVPADLNNDETMTSIGVLTPDVPSKSLPTTPFGTTVQPPRRQDPNVREKGSRPRSHSKSSSNDTECNNNRLSLAMKFSLGGCERKMEYQQLTSTEEKQSDVPPPPSPPPDREDYYEQYSGLMKRTEVQETQQTREEIEHYVAVASYPPQNETEVELIIGDIITVHKIHGDGWLSGTLVKNGRSGLLPASFVVPVSRKSHSSARKSQKNRSQHQTFSAFL